MKQITNANFLRTNVSFTMLLIQKENLESLNDKKYILKRGKGFETYLTHASTAAERRKFRVTQRPRAFNQHCGFQLKKAPVLAESMGCGQTKL